MALPTLAGAVAVLENQLARLQLLLAMAALV
jgi:hypothetical protein